MPYAWTHIIFGDEIAKKVQRVPKEKHLYQLGCQGPDFFFFYRFWPWLKSNPGTALGDLFHTMHCGPVLLDLIKRAKKVASLQAYVAGFITHHILDRTTHAYIHYHAGYRKYKHQKLESIIDTLLALKRRDLKTWETPIVPQIDVGKNLPQEVVTCLSEVASTYYAEEATHFPEKEYHRAYRDMKTFFNFTFDPSGIKNILTFGLISPFRFTNHFPDRDYLNLEHHVWLHPAMPEEEHTESFWDLWKIALEDGEAVTKKVYDYWLNGGSLEGISSIIKNISYDNGKECTLGLENKVSSPIV